MSASPNPHDDDDARTGKALKGDQAVQDHRFGKSDHHLRGPSVRHEAMNAPDRFELFLLGDGEKKCSEVADTRTPNSSVFTFEKEDHTLGNLLRAHLLKNPHVIFSGYKVPHPLFAKFELRVQTDGDITPKEALVNTCKNIVSDLATLSREFTKEYELRKMVSGGGATVNGNANGNN